MRISTLKVPSLNQIKPTLGIIILSLAITLASFLIYSQFGVGFSDEGFVWYGMMRTSLGEVPIRDFQSYDPGRYYWGAFWFKIFNNHGPIAFRASLALFEFAGLTFALLILKRITKSWSVLFLEGLLISAWMYVHYKTFDITVSVAAVYFAILLLENSSLKKHLISGIFVGFSAFIGINHGLYNSVSFFSLILFIWFKFDKFNHDILLKRFLFWGLGILIGYSPMLLMYAVVPGFFNAYIDWINSIFNNGTNISLPIPWPWSINYSILSPAQSLRAFSQSIYFLIFPIFNLTAIVYLIFSKPENLKNKYVFIATTFVGLTYIHYAFDRADLIHLSFAIIPLLIGLLSLPIIIDFNGKLVSNIFKVCLLAFIFITTVLSVGSFTPWNQAKVIAQASNGQRSDYIAVPIQGNKLWWTQEDADMIKSIQKINSQLIGKDESIFLAPSLPGIYAILEKRSPTKITYFLFKETPENQNAMIDELKQNKVSLAIVQLNQPVDGREDLHFTNAYSLLWQYLNTNFSILNNEQLPAGIQLMKRRL